MYQICIFFNYSLHHGVKIGIPTGYVFIYHYLSYFSITAFSMVLALVFSSLLVWPWVGSTSPTRFPVDILVVRVAVQEQRHFLVSALFPSKTQEKLFFSLQLGLPRMVSPAVIMGAIFNVSFDLIGLQKIELFLKICEIFAKKVADF